MTSSSARNKFVGQAISIFSFFLLFSFLALGASAAPAISDASIPQRWQTGSPIPIYVNMTCYNNDSYEVALYYEQWESAYPVKVQMSLLAGNYTDGAWFAELPAQEWGGTVTCSVVVDNGAARYPSQGTVAITIDGPSRSKITSEMILLAVFLVIAFIALELAFKPGFWRPTGRERARKLEEEDRKKEEEEKKAKQKEEKTG